MFGPLCVPEAMGFRYVTSDFFFFNDQLYFVTVNRSKRGVLNLDHKMTLTVI